jgi:hypothetical protein
MKAESQASHWGGSPGRLLMSQPFSYIDTLSRQPFQLNAAYREVRGKKIKLAGD